MGTFPIFLLIIATFTFAQQTAFALTNEPAGEGKALKDEEMTVGNSDAFKFPVLANSDEDANGHANVLDAHRALQNPSDDPNGTLETSNSNGKKDSKANFNLVEGSSSPSNGVNDLRLKRAIRKKGRRRGGGGGGGKKRPKGGGGDGDDGGGKKKKDTDNEDKKKKEEDNAKKRKNPNSNDGFVKSAIARAGEAVYSWGILDWLPQHIRENDYKMGLIVCIAAAVAFLCLLLAGTVIALCCRRKKTILNLPQEYEMNNMNR